MTDPLVVNPEVELPQLDISNNYTEDCTIEYSTGKTKFYWTLLFSLSFHTHNTRDPGSRPTFKHSISCVRWRDMIGMQSWCMEKLFSSLRCRLPPHNALEHNTSRNKYFDNWQQFQPNIFFLKSSKEQHELSLKKKLFIEKLIECHFEDLLYFVYIILKCGVINFLVSGSHLPGWD